MRYISYVGPCCRTFNNKNKKQGQGGQSKFTLKPRLTNTNEILRYIEEWSNLTHDLMRSVVYELYGDLIADVSAEELEAGINDMLSPVHIPFNSLTNDDVLGFDVLGTSVVYGKYLFAYYQENGIIISYEGFSFRPSPTSDGWKGLNEGSENIMDVGTLYKVDEIPYEFKYPMSTPAYEMPKESDVEQLMTHVNVEEIRNSNDELTAIKLYSKEINIWGIIPIIDDEICFWALSNDKSTTGVVKYDTENMRIYFVTGEQFDENSEYPVRLVYDLEH